MAVPYGSWPSVLSTDALVAGALRLGAPEFAGDALIWQERRPQERGRGVLVRGDASGAREDLTPAPFDVRTRVHEYGGAAWLPFGDGVVFSNDADGRLYRVGAGGAQPEPLTPEPPAPRALRYADGVAAPDGSIVCVRETHGAGEAINEIVRVPAGGGEPEVVATAHDFFAAPRLSPDGSRLLHLTWEHPRMPWDGTELWVDGEKVAGGAEESIVSPAWGPDGSLYYVSDRSGWWNLYRDGEPVAPIEAELGAPAWAFGMQTYVFLDDGSIVCAVIDGGRSWLGRIAPGSDRIERVEAQRTPGGIPRLVTDGTRVAYAGASATLGPAVVVLDVVDGSEEVIAAATGEPLDEAWISVPREIEFPADDGATGHALYWPPRNPEVSAPDGERPPLLLGSHGGPTGQVDESFDIEIQYWTSRGFGVCEVNYGGSTGYGRAYRERLRDKWGIVDVDDCVAAARALADAGEVDGARIAIRGGSAGGYTTLRALTTTDTFAAGASYYGVGDLGALARDTHKFEARYLDGLIGPWPEAEDVYAERSPINHVDGLSCPVILLQGLEDPVVPPAQAEEMVAALQRKGIPHEYLAFEGEQHGFRRADTIKRATEAELAFYGRVFGFEPRTQGV